MNVTEAELTLQTAPEFGKMIDMSDNIIDSISSIDWCVRVANGRQAHRKSRRYGTADVV